MSGLFRVIAQEAVRLRGSAITPIGEGVNDAWAKHVG